MEMHQLLHHRHLLIKSCANRQQQLQLITALCCTRSARGLRGWRHDTGGPCSIHCRKIGLCRQAITPWLPSLLAGNLESAKIQDSAAVVNQTPAATHGVWWLDTRIVCRTRHLCGSSRAAVGTIRDC